MKKLISIGVALALVAMVVLPLGAAAQEGCPDIGYTYPTTFAKIPFAILESGFAMVSEVLAALPDDIGLPEWLPDIVDAIGPWTGGPLAWSVDMLGWGLSLVGGLLTLLAGPLGLPEWLDDVVNGLACGIFAPFSCNVTGVTFTPCGS